MGETRITTQAQSLVKSNHVGRSAKDVALRLWALLVIDKTNLIWINYLIHMEAKNGNFVHVQRTYAPGDKQCLHFSLFKDWPLLAKYWTRSDPLTRLFFFLSFFTLLHPPVQNLVPFKQ